MSKSRAVFGRVVPESRKVILSFPSNNVYVKVFKDRFVLRRLKDGAPAVTVTADAPFTTRRLLVGQFAAAERSLKRGLTELFAGSWFSPSPVVVIQPMEMIEGGLSEIEDRALRELVMGAGARKVVIWIGHELSDFEANELAKNA